MVVLNVFFNDVDDDAGRGLVVRQADGTLRDVPVRGEPSSIRTLGAAQLAMPGPSSRIHSWPEARETPRRAGSAPKVEPLAKGARFDDGLALQAREIGWLNAAAAANGARLVVVSIPVKQIFYTDNMPSGDDRWKSDAIARSLTASCESAGIPFIDLTAALRDAVRASPSRLYFVHDSHPTPDGYRAIAAAVASFLAPMLAKPADSARPESPRDGGA